MAAGCVPTCAKYSLFIFNVVFFIGGGVALGIGLWMTFDTQAAHTLVRVAGAIQGDDGSNTINLPQELMPGVLLHGGYILIAAGAAALIFSFLGCCGAMKESQCCLSLYAICLMVILGLEIAVGIYAVAAKQSFKNSAQSIMERTLEDNYMNTSANGITFGWNRMMAELECCGVYDYKGFQRAHYWRQQNPTQLMPVQCCKLKDKKRFVPEDNTCTQYPTEQNSNYMKGCYDSLIKVLEVNVTTLIIVGIGIGSSQLLGIILTFILCCSVDPYKD